MIPDTILLNLLIGDLLSKFIEYLSKGYDLVIIDTPAVLAVTDTSIIRLYVGMSFILIRFNNLPLKRLMQLQTALGFTA